MINQILIEAGQKKESQEQPCDSPNSIYFLQLKTDQGVLNKKIILQK